MKSSSTQQFVEIEEIKQGVIFLKTGGLRQILMIEGINFDLKSEEERNLILYSFQNFLNALDFSLQILIHSRKVNLESYLENLQKRKSEETNELLKTQIQEHQEFLSAFISQHPIMDKSFFAVVPYDPIILPSATKGFSKFFGKGKKNSSVKKTEEQDLKEKLFQLNQRTEQIVVGLQQIGLPVIPLNTKATTELIYNLYNPQEREKQELKIAE